MAFYLHEKHENKSLAKMAKHMVCCNMFYFLSEYAECAM